MGGEIFRDLQQGAAAIVQEEKNLIRQYLLGQLDDTDQEQVELKLMSDSSYAQEFDITVDEITDQYVAGELSQDERSLVEKHFLKAPDRREKVAFASALASHVAHSSKPTPRVAPAPSKPTFFENVAAFLRAQSPLMRSAFALAVVAIGVFAYFAWQGNRNYLALTLTLRDTTRGVGLIGPTPEVVLGDHGGLNVTLMLPEEI